MKQHVLIVEDNPLNSELLRDWLEMQGYVAVIAPSLDAGFAALKKQQPDVVLLDVQLGEEDGLSLAAWMHQQPALKDIPVIAVTAQVMTSDRQRILESGCHSIVSKPVEFNVLRGQLEVWLGRNGHQGREGLRHGVTID
jgi:two-component system cell cycle response regulator DivK